MSDDLTPIATIPAALRRAGIKRVVDNVPPGGYIAGFEPEFVKILAKQIRTCLFSKPEPVTQVKRADLSDDDAASD